jgi:hypothetical protein
MYFIIDDLRTATVPKIVANYDNVILLCILLQRKVTVSCYLSFLLSIWELNNLLCITVPFSHTRLVGRKWTRCVLVGALTGVGVEGGLKAPAPCKTDVSDIFKWPRTLPNF